MSYLDTHVAAWLHAGRKDLFPEAACSRIECSQLLISPIVVLELQYLYEIGRLKEPAAPVLEELGRSVGLRVCDLAFERVVEAALLQTWTRDPFDRFIVAQASQRDAALLTKDSHIAQHYRLAIWS